MQKCSTQPPQEQIYIRLIALAGLPSLYPASSMSVVKVVTGLFSLLSKFCRSGLSSIVGVCHGAPSRGGVRCGVFRTTAFPLSLDCGGLPENGNVPPAGPVWGARRKSMVPVLAFVLRLLWPLPDVEREAMVVALSLLLLRLGTAPAFVGIWNSGSVGDFALGDRVPKFFALWKEGERGFNKLLTRPPFFVVTASPGTDGVRWRCVEWLRGGGVGVTTLSRGLTVCSGVCCPTMVEFVSQVPIPSRGERYHLLLLDGVRGRGFLPISGLPRECLMKTDRFDNEWSYIGSEILCLCRVDLMRDGRR